MPYGKPSKDGIVRPSGYSKDPMYKYLGHFANDDVLAEGHNDLLDYLPGGAERKRKREEYEAGTQKDPKVGAPIPDAPPNPGANPTIRGRREMEEKLLKEKY